MQKGLVVRGFVSKIDNSVQPYGLIIPESYDPQSNTKYRTDTWLHGRNEKTLEISFIHQRMKSIGKFAPENTIVLHPYGRYSNAPSNLQERQTSLKHSSMLSSGIKLMQIASVTVVFQWGSRVLAIGGSLSRSIFCLEPRSRIFRDSGFSDYLLKWEKRSESLLTARKLQTRLVLITIKAGNLTSQS